MGWITADGFPPIDTNTWLLALLAWALLGGLLYWRLTHSHNRIRSRLSAAVDQLDQLRGRDPLTGLITRPEFELALEEAALECDHTSVPPVSYTHLLPPPVRLQYALRRGGVTGTAHLDWTREDGRYRLSLQGHLSATPQAAWISQGLLDAAGVAPERYTESRRGREARAANFQREAGRISFSGPSHEYPCLLYTSRCV